MKTTAEEILSKLQRTQTDLGALREKLERCTPEEVGAHAVPLERTASAVLTEAMKLGALTRAGRAIWPAPEIWASLTQRSGRPV